MLLFNFILQENVLSKVQLEKLKSIKSSAPGSMAAYLELRQREKQADLEIPQPQSQAEDIQQLDHGNLIYLVFYA